MDPFELRTERLILRRATVDDLDEWHRLVFDDPGVTTYLSLQGRTLPREEMGGVLERGADHWDQRGYGVWLVCLVDSGQVLGHCGLRHLDEIDDVEVLYAYGREHWGRGYATEAGGAALRFGFDRAGLGRIVALAVPENRASIRVMEKLGMVFEKEADVFGMRCVQYAISRDGIRPPTPPEHP